MSSELTQQDNTSNQNGQAMRVSLFQSIACFDYQLPPQDIKPGCRVIVPVRSQERIAIVLGKVESSVPPNKLRAICKVLDEEPIISETLLTLLQWVADYYQSPLATILRAAIPAAIRNGKPPKLSQYQVWECCENELSTEEITKALKGTKKQKIIYQALQREGPLDDTSLKSRFIAWRPSMRALVKKGLVQSHPWIPDPKQAQQAADYALTDEQQTAIEAVRAKPNTFACYLLQGITGSGKTEVYLNLSTDAVSGSRQVLVLVPEISLIMQTAARFYRRLGKRVACFHSGLGVAERLHCWSRVANGDIDVVVGTRSAVFLPFHDLGLIIVDEEHDHSYKDDHGSCYHARDVAIKRAQLSAIPIVLGSATPSLESIHNALSEGKYQHLQLTQRFGKLPVLKQHIIDMRTQPTRHGLSQDLLQAIERCLERDEQVLLFINRRGYAPVILCKECGAPCDCPRCDAHMVYHAKRRKLHCHHCATTAPLPKVCPACGKETLKAVGIGIEQVEKALQEIYPGVSIARFDRDAIRRRAELEEALDRASAGEAKILLGTQMLIKGHHFTRVSLVGVINVDNALFSADFRSEERLAQTLVQVSGRAGRGDVSGEVWVQTHHPQHPNLQLLATQDYSQVVGSLLAERKRSFLPPYCRLALFRAEAKSTSLAMQFLQEFFNRTSKTCPQDVQIYPPMPALMERRQGFHRARLLIKASDGHTLRRFLQEVMPSMESNRFGSRVRWHIDIDPTDID